MPICLDPTITVDVWLESDAHKPVETRPTFIARYCSILERREFWAALDSIDKAETADAQVAILSPILDRCFVGWRNVGREFARGVWEELLVLSEFVLLLLAYLERTLANPSRNPKPEEPPSTPVPPAGT